MDKMCTALLRTLHRKHPFKNLNLATHYDTIVTGFFSP